MEMSFCNSSGMPHSAFLAWDEIDRAKALAFEIEKSLRCSMCGTAPWEWEEDRFAYAPVQSTCTGCAIKESTAHEQDSQPGMTIELVPKAEAKRLAEKPNYRTKRRRGDDADRE